MPENKPLKPEKVTIEKLLTLKRHEKPDGAFWERFDRELHQKTLRSVVRRSQTYFAWRAFFARIHVALPITGAAAFALAFLVSNGYLSTAGFNQTEVAPILTAHSPVSPVSGPEEATVNHTPPNSAQASYVVSTLPANDLEPSSYTQVAASKSITSGYQPGVQYVSGRFSPSIGNLGNNSGIY